jgi:uncharacterized protein (DUF1684 family)
VVNFNPQEIAELLDWKRTIFDAYNRVRDADHPQPAWERWRRTRDELFASHPQSPLPPEHRVRFQGLSFFDYDPAFRVLAAVNPSEHAHYDIATSGGTSYRFTRFGVAAFELPTGPQSLELYWLDSYGGGLFLPFRDTTSGAMTYGAGRYLLDTVKGADLGTAEGGLILDFNFSYNPSCAYDPQWVCPLAPPPNRLKIAIEAGERVPS